MNLQRTLKKSICLEGLGLHSGKSASISIHPAPVHHGISFKRKDLIASPEIAASFKNIVSTQLATTLGVGTTTISTVEHVLAALQGMGVDNARIEVDGPEIPILDGSSIAFCDAIKRVGIETQAIGRRTLAIRRKIEVRLGEKWAVIEPSSRLEIHASIDWDHPAIGYQEYHFIEGRNSFSELASARTFGFLKDVEALKKIGLARGGSLENAVVLDDAFVLNPEGLRYSDEFVRHKVLDALGDFLLSGFALQGYFRIHRSGHDLHSRILAEIFRDPDHYEILSDGASEEVVRPIKVAVLAQAFA